MKDIDAIRRENLRLLEAEAGGPAEMARRLEMSQAQFTNLRNGAKDSKTGKPRGMRKETARRIEGALGKDPGWLDTDQTTQSTPPTQLATTQLPQNSHPATPWPFEGIDCRKVLALDAPTLHRLEGALLLAAGQMQLNIAHTPKSLRAHG